MSGLLSNRLSILKIRASFFITGKSFLALASSKMVNRDLMYSGLLTYVIAVIVHIQVDIDCITNITISKVSYHCIKIIQMRKRNCLLILHSFESANDFPSIMSSNFINKAEPDLLIYIILISMTPLYDLIFLTYSVPLILDYKH